MRILISAYACEPGRGSEPGAGWHFATAAAAAGHEVVVLTRENNQTAIEAGLAPLAQRDRLTFAYVDLPAWARRWKRGGRGVRTYYFLWQVAALRAARRLHASRRFDAVHHVTFANVWQPALASLVDAPFVLGPVGGGPAVPVGLYGALGARGAVLELLLRASRLASRANPFVRHAWRRAAVVLTQNDETLAALPAGVRRRAFVRPNATADPLLARGAAPTGCRVAVVSGRLLPWKGVILALEALTHAPGWRLEIVGDGPERRRLERRARELGVTDRVELTGRLPQAELADRLARADAVLLPSLREDASFAAVEAQAIGVPVVAFDRGGPRALAREPRARFVLQELAGRAESARNLAAGLELALTLDRSAELPDYGPGRLAHDLAGVYAGLPTALPSADPVTA